jgi:type I restriction enzyme, S subunit
MNSIRLGDVCEKIGSGATPRGGSEVYQSRGVSLIRSQNVYNDGFKMEGLAYIGDEHAKQLENVSVQADDVLLNITGDSVARVCQVPESLLPARVNQHVAIIRPRKDILDARYLKYFLSSTLMQEHMLALASAGATRNALTKSMIEGFKVPALALNEQRAIAHILGTLDDKIELNRCMNETLEAMAQALFKSWFVDFDPVRAKAEKRQPTGMDAETAALFPSSFEESPLGPIPKHWKLGKFAELTTLNRTAINPNQYPEEVFDHFSIPAYDEGMMPKQEVGGQIMSNKFLVVPNCVLLSKLNPRFPRVWLPDLSAASHQAVCSTEFLVLLSKAQATREWIYALVSSGSFSEILSSLVTGTSGSHQRVKPEHLFEVNTVIPAEALIRSFTKMVKPIFAMITQNLQQSRTLAALRDSLLPKLLSGEIRVREAEREVGQVA